MAFRLRIKLPDGRRVSELPGDIEAGSTAGSFDLKWRFEEGILHVDRTLRLETLEIPLAEYPESRAFLDKVADATGVSVILEHG